MVACTHLLSDGANDYLAAKLDPRRSRTDSEPVICEGPKEVSNMLEQLLKGTTRRDGVVWGNACKDSSAMRVETRDLSWCAMYWG